MAGHSLVMLGWSWTELIVLGTVVSRPSRAKFRFFLNVIFFHHKYHFILFMGPLKPIIELSNTLCMLQAICRHAAGQAEIRPLVWNQTSAIYKCQIKFSKHRALFLVIAKVKQDLFWKKAWKGLSNEGGTKWTRSWGHDKKNTCSQIMAQKHDFLSITPWFFPLCISFIWKPLPCSFQNRSCFPCSYNQKKCWVLKIFFMKIALLGGLVLAKPLCGQSVIWTSLSREQKHTDGHCNLYRLNCLGANIVKICLFKGAP